MKKASSHFLGQKAQKCFKQRSGWGIGCLGSHFPLHYVQQSHYQGVWMYHEKVVSPFPAPPFSKDGSFTGNIKTHFCCVLLVILI